MSAGAKIQTHLSTESNKIATNVTITFSCAWCLSSLQAICTLCVAHVKCGEQARVENRRRPPCMGDRRMRKRRNLLNVWLLQRMHEKRRTAAKRDIWCLVAEGCDYLETSWAVSLWTWMNLPDPIFTSYCKVEFDSYIFIAFLLLRRAPTPYIQSKCNIEFNINI